MMFKTSTQRVCNISLYKRQFHCLCSCRDSNCCIMLISPEQEALIDRVFETYLTDHHHNDILQLIEETEENEDTHRPLVVNAMTLFEANMEVMLTQVSVFGDIDKVSSLRFVCLFKKEKKSHVSWLNSE